jgi:RNA polymerase sigma-B factor
MATPTYERRTRDRQDPQLGALVRRWQTRRDVRARDRIFEDYYPLACRLANRYRNPYEPREDLVQVAAAGLLYSIDRYDPDRGVAFVAFAIPTILGELKRHFRNTGWSVHVPRGAQELARRVERSVQEITSRGGRSPTVPEIAQYMEIEVEDVLVGLHAAAAHYSVSLDAPAPGSDHDDPQTLSDGLADAEDGYGLVEAKLSLVEAMRHLPHTERVALDLRIHEDLKQSEIAVRMGCSQMQVSRLLSRAIFRLRELTDPEIVPAADLLEQRTRGPISLRRGARRPWRARASAAARSPTAPAAASARRQPTAGRRAVPAEHRWS